MGGVQVYQLDQTITCVGMCMPVTPCLPHKHHEKYGGKLYEDVNSAFEDLCPPLIQWTHRAFIHVNHSDGWEHIFRHMSIQ